MEEDKLVTVKYYDTVVDAEFDNDILRKNGIESVYQNSTVVGVFPIFDDKERGIELMVFEKDLERATALLEEYHNAVDNPSILDESNEE